MAQSGAVWTSKNVANQLYEQNRDYNNRQTWHTALAENTAQGATALAELERQYNTATNEAYVSYLKNKNALQNSAVAGEGKDELLSQNDLALQEAYDSYRNSLAEGSAQIASAVAESEIAINKALEEQAQYTADYANLHWDYLDQLFHDYSQGENTIFDSKLWSKYTVDEPVLDAEGDPMHDDQGNPVTEKRIMTRDELASQLYDENGNLTMQGVDFYDQIENAVAQGGTGMSWGDYLAENNEDLFNWATSYNPYNYTFESTNAGTFRTMVGMAADDNQWSFAERYGGLSEEQINSMYQPIKDKLTQLADISYKSNPTEALDLISDVADDIWIMADELGLQGDMLDAGIDKTTFDNILQQAYASTTDETDMAGQGTLQIFGSTGIGALIGLIGGPVGALIGGSIGLVTSTAAVIVTAYDQQDQNKQILDAVEKGFTDLLNNTVNMSLKAKRQADIEFANKMGR